MEVLDLVDGGLEELEEMVRGCCFLFFSFCLLWLFLLLWVLLLLGAWCAEWAGWGLGV